MFKYISPAEYQSIVFMPSEDDFVPNDRLFFSMLELDFEYWDGVSETYAQTQPNETSGKKHAESITINIGFRYFDHEAGTFTASAETQKTIQFGKFPTYAEYGEERYPEALDAHSVAFSDSETGGAISVVQGGGELEIKNKFNNGIGDNAINAFANGTEIEGSEGKAKSLRINGNTAAKDFYSFNKSSSYGYYGTLNPEKFVGEGGCDYIEVYFDVVKEKGALGVDYSFKVSTGFLAIRESQAG